MGFFRKQMISVFLMSGLVVLGLTGCSDKKEDNSKVERLLEEQEPEKQLQNDREIDLAQNPEDAQDTEDVNKTKPEAEEVEIPVYGNKAKKKVQKLLAKLPNEFLSRKEQKNLGLLSASPERAFFTEAERKECEGDWMSFYAAVSEHDKMLEEGKKGEGVYDVSMEKAVILVNYTTEGDAIYDYLSYKNGTYFWYSDNSRDAFGSGEAEYMVFEELRMYTIYEEEVTQFYLVKDADTSKEQLERWITSGEGYGDKIIHVCDIKGTK